MRKTSGRAMARLPVSKEDGELMATNQAQSAPRADALFWRHRDRGLRPHPPFSDPHPRLGRLSLAEAVLLPAPRDQRDRLPAARAAAALGDPPGRRDAHRLRRQRHCLDPDGPPARPGVVVDISEEMSDWAVIKPHHITDRVEVRKGDILLYHTGYSRHFNGGARRTRNATSCATPAATARWPNGSSRWNSRGPASTAPPATIR